MVAIVSVLTWSCVNNPAPTEPEEPVPPPSAASIAPAPPPPLPDEPPPLPPVLLPDNDFESRTLEELNRELPLIPVFFNYDSSDIDEQNRTVLDANAQFLQEHPTWVVTIEGHCDERGTPEYNLGLGERRALAARQYLLELGLPLSRLRTVSYGKEFPFDPGHNENAWAKNRRAHFVITAQ